MSILWRQFCIIRHRDMQNAHRRPMIMHRSPVFCLSSLIFKKYYPLIATRVISHRYLAVSVSIHIIRNPSCTENTARSHFTARTSRRYAQAQSDVTKPPAVGSAKFGFLYIGKIHTMIVKILVYVIPEYGSPHRYSNGSACRHHPHIAHDKSRHCRYDQHCNKHSTYQVCSATVILLRCVFAV